MEKARNTRQGSGEGLCPRTGLPPSLAEPAQLTAHLGGQARLPDTFRVLLLHRAEREKRRLSSLSAFPGVVPLHGARRRPWPSGGLC